MNSKPSIRKINKMKKANPPTAALAPQHRKLETRNCKRPTRLVPAALCLLAGALALSPVTSPAQGANGTWNSTANGNWSDTTKWSGGTVATGATFLATFQANITAFRTITLDASMNPMTIGNVNFVPNSRGWTLAGSFPLNLDNGASIVQFKSAQLTNTCSVVLTGAVNGIKMPDKGNSSATLVLAAANTWNGDTYVESGNTGANAGTLRIGNSAAIPHGAGKGNVYLSLAGSTDGALDLNGFSITINGLGGGTSGGQVKNTSTTAATLTVGDNDATSTFDGLLVDGAGKVALSKTGSGTLTLSGLNGAHTYSGATTISAGKLTCSTGGSCANSDVSVGASGTLNVQYTGSDAT